MKPMMKTALAIFLLGAMGSTAALADDSRGWRDDRRDIRQESRVERQELRDGKADFRRDLRQERRDYRREIRHERCDARRERRSERYDRSHHPRNVHACGCTTKRVLTPVEAALRLQHRIHERLLQHIACAR